MDNGFSIGLNYSDLDGLLVGNVAMDSHMGIGIAYTMDALTVAANYGEYDLTLQAALIKMATASWLPTTTWAVALLCKFGYGSGYDRPDRPQAKPANAGRWVLRCRSNPSGLLQGKSGPCARSFSFGRMAIDSVYGDVG